MPQASAVFSLQAHNNRSNWVHCGALFAGGVSAAASLHRGVDLSADVDLETRISGEFQKAVVANLNAGGDAEAEITLEAAFPIDLFKAAGVVAKAEAKAEAAAWVQATVGLDIGFFETQLLKGAVNGIWLQLLDIFVSELSISAGVWASASFSAEAWAEAFFVGNLVTLDDGSPPGFTFSCGYGAGWGCGYGADFIVNLGITDSARMLNRLADRVCQELETEIQSLVSGVPAADAAAAQRGLAFLNLILPLATRTAFEAGVTLVSQDPQSSDKTSGIVRAFVREAQELVLKSVVDVATASVKGRLQVVFGGTLPSFDVPTQGQISDAIDGAVDAITQLASLDVSDPDSWFPAATQCANALVALAGTPVFSGSIVDEHRNDVALFWAAATLVRRIVSWAGSTDPNADTSSGNPFDTTTVPSGADGALIAYIAARPIFGAQGNAPKPSGASLTYADLVAFILADDATRNTVQAIESQFPEIAPVVQWLASTCSSLGGAQLLPFLLGDATSLLAGNTAQAATALGSAISSVVDQEIVPNLFSRLINSPNPATVELTCRVIRPTVTALGRVVVPGIINVTNDDQASVVREQISAVLLQFLTRFLITSADLISAKGFSDGATFLQNLSTDVRQNGLGGRADALVQLCATDLPGLAPTNDDFADILKLLGDAVALFNQNVRGPVVAVVENLVSFGLFSDNTMSQVYALENPNNPSDPAGLSDLVNALQDGLWDSLQILVPEGVAIVENHFKRIGVQIEALVTAGVHDVVTAIEQAAQWVEQQVQNLEQAVALAEQDVLVQVANISAAVQQLSSEAIALEQQISDSLQAYGWSLVQPWLQGMPDAVTGAAQGIYNGLFMAADALLEAPLQTLGQVAGWVHDEAVLELQSGSLSPQNIVQAVRQQILQAAASDLTFPVSVTISATLGDSFFGYYTVSQTFNIGTFTIPAATVLNTIADAVFNDTNISGYINSIVGYFQALQGDQIQIASGQAAIANSQAQVSAPQIVTGQPLVATIVSPGGGSLWNLSAPLSLQISGADATFFADTQGVAPRARLYLNGNAVPYTADEWVQNGSDFTFTATVVPSRVGLVPDCVRFSTVSDQSAHRQAAARVAKRRAAAPAPTRTKILPGAVPRQPGTPTVRPATSGIFSNLPNLTLLDQAAGYRWLLPPAPAVQSGSEAIDPDTPDTPAAPAAGTRVLVGQAGLNTVQVVIVDGDTQQTQDVHAFHLRNSNTLPHKLYAAAFSSVVTGTQLVTGHTQDAFIASWQTLSGQGMRLFKIGTYTAGGQRLWTGLFTPGQDNYVLLFGLAWDALVAKCNELGPQGLHLVSFAPYDDGQLLWAGVWRPGTGPGALFCSDGQTFGTQFSTYGAQGLRLMELQTYVDGNGTRMWAGIWAQGTGGYYMQGDMDWAAFMAKHQDLTNAGLCLASFVCYANGDQRFFAGTWTTTIQGTTQVLPGKDLAGLQSEISARAAQGFGLSDVAIFPGYL